MTYTVEKLSASQWQIMRFEIGRTIGTIVGIKPTREEAMQHAKRLAGRTGVVHYFETYKRA